MKYSQRRNRNCIAIVCCVMFSACAYLPSFSKGKALNMAEGNIEEEVETSPDFYFQDSVFISNPVVVLTKSWHKYIMSQHFYESFDGLEKDLILSDSVFVFGYGYPLRYALQMEPFVSKSQIDLGESLQPKSIFQKVRSIHNGCGWYYVFCFKEEVYYKNFVVIDSKEQLVKIPAEKKGYVQIAFAVY